MKSEFLHIPLRSVPARFGWSWTTKASTPRNGRRSTRLPRRSAARARHCATGCGRPNVTRVFGRVRQQKSASGSRRSSVRTVSCARRTRSCGRRRHILPRRSSTAGSSHDRLYQRAPRIHGVKPICRVLPIAPSTYHAHAARRVDPGRLPARAHRDAAVKVEIGRVYDANFRVYGVRKVWRQLGREGIAVARCTVARLMRPMGLQGVVRGKTIRTTISNAAAPCPLDRVNRQFRAPRPNTLWVSDFTSVATWAGVVYVAFVIDAFARRIVGWRVSRTAHAGFVLVALEQALHGPHPVPGSGLGHHSDRGVQYVSIKYTERLAEAGFEPSVGSVGYSDVNALAETINGLYKAEVIHRRGPWRSFDAVEFATLEWVDWFNNAPLLEPIGNLPPAEAEATYYAQLVLTCIAA